MHSPHTFTTSNENLPEGDLNSLLERQRQQNVASVTRFHAICETEEFDFVYMPVCQLSNGTIHHFEALTRFRESPETSPYEMITLAEEVGIIAEFDLVVTAKAIAQLLKSRGFGNWVLE